MKRRRGGWRAGLERPETIDAILARAGEDRFSPEKPPVSLTAWRAAVGPRIADQTVPLSIEGPADDRVLVVRTSSSAWASELSMLSEMILSRLSQHHIRVSRLVFRTGRIELPQRPLERRVTRRIPAPVALPKTLARELDGVGDEELREEIRRAAARSLAFAANELPPNARGPRFAEKEIARPDRTARAAPEAPPRNRANDRGRSR